MSPSQIESRHSSYDNVDEKTTTATATLEAEALETTGIVPEEKPFNMVSIAALGYSIMNTGAAVLFPVSSNIYFGGGPLFFWGCLAMVFVGYCTAISLGELSSAYPHAGGQYYFVARLAPKKMSRPLAYFTAILSWSSVVCVCASACAATANTVFQLVAIQYPDFEHHQWTGFLIFQGVNLIIAVSNIYERFLPTLGKLTTGLSTAVLISFFICFLAPNHPKASAAEVFTKIYNVSGWTDGVAFIIGMNGMNWAFSGLDAITHLAEEIPNPRKNIPYALLVAVSIGAATAIPTILAIFFTDTDIPNTTSVFSLLYALYNHDRVPVIALGTLLGTTGTCSIIGVHTWQSRIAWSLSRDRGFPFHHYQSRIAPAPFNTPLWAHLWSVCWVALSGFVYLASTTAFNSLVSAGILLQYITYCIPVALLLARGRQNFEHGPFWHPWIGFFANIVLLSWAAIALVFYSFPYFLPVAADQMNYVSAVLVFIFLYAAAYWFLYARKQFVISAVIGVDI